MDRLIEAIEDKQNPSVVGLDPTEALVPKQVVASFAEEIAEQVEDPTEAPAAQLSVAFFEFNRAIIDAVADIVPAVKPQIAMYEALGPDGIDAYSMTCEYAKQQGLYVLGDVNPMATFSLITLIPSMLGCFTSQFWCNKLKHKGKAIAITYAVQVVMYVAQYFLFRNTINVTLLYVLGIVLQYFAGANMSIIYGMVPDTVEVTEYQTKGIRMDGFLNTVSSFWNKVGITIGTSGAPLILALTGYVANAPTQTPAVIEGLQLMKWIMPAAFNLICLICLFWYKLGYKEFDELVAKIAAERPQWEQTTAEK